ncbi:MAG: hypothetical protein C4532_14935 [Candidatus Abyssobacteria bacterium SURF_17]|uniref:Uncharacterized protein n=1 Tax=Candidatus Abyssobacteria bacterium SURF_17 TaxID=2093361 RepID=A0A419ETI3_9BACT|nr:MAG: hypothetical protein C4532_14935 [Candidatus Abyssubacteria bacterium SURF_17]
MGSIIVLSLLTIAAFIALCSIFNKAKIELGVPTIAAMEARAGMLQAEADVEAKGEEDEPASQEYARAALDQTGESGAETTENYATMNASGYEYRELPVEAGENYVLPQWIVNFFSSGELCHTLDPSDNVVFIAKLNDAGNASSGAIDISADSDMSTQTIAVKVCFGQGAAAETLKTKFYLFERGDLFELNRLVRQSSLRIDILTRSADYALEYADTIHTKIPPGALTQLKGVLTKIPT